MLQIAPMMPTASAALEGPREMVAVALEGLKSMLSARLHGLSERSTSQGSCPRANRCVQSWLIFACAVQHALVPQ